MAAFIGLLSSEQIGLSRDCRPCCSARCSAPCEPLGATSLEAAVGGTADAGPLFAPLESLPLPPPAPAARDASRGATNTYAELARTLRETFELRPSGDVAALVWWRDGDGDADREDESWRTAGWVLRRVGDGEGDVPGCPELLRLGNAAGPRCSRRFAMFCSLNFSLKHSAHTCRSAAADYCTALH